VLDEDVDDGSLAGARFGGPNPGKYAVAGDGVEETLGDDASLPESEEMGQGLHGGAVGVDELLDKRDLGDGGTDAVGVVRVQVATLEGLEGADTVATGEDMLPVDGRLTGKGLLVVVPRGRVPNVDRHGPIFDDVVSSGLLGAAHGGTPAVPEDLEQFLARDDGGGLNGDVEVHSVGCGRGFGTDTNVPAPEVGVDALGHDGVVDGHDVGREGSSRDLVVGGGDGHVKLVGCPVVVGPHSEHPLAVASVVRGDEVAGNLYG